MPADDRFKFPDDFLAKIDAGQVDDDFVRELGNLIEERRGELARILIEREQSN